MNDDRNQPGSPSPRTVAALGASIKHFAMRERYRDYVIENVIPLCRSLEECDALGKNHQDTLLGSEFHHLMLIIWKESSFVTAAELAALGSSKVFRDIPFNCHSLGLYLVDDTTTVSAATQQVRKHVAIAMAYQLVQQEQQGRSLELRATQHLNDLFLAIGSAPARDRTAQVPNHPPVVIAKP